MTALQTINLGTAPTGTGGDTVYTAFTKVNSNVAALQNQEALTSATPITSSQALTAATYIGKRVNFSSSSAIVAPLPQANTCAPDQVILLRNLGTGVVTLPPATGSTDTVNVAQLNPGETALIDTDGVSVWNTLMRGRTNSANEVVNGNSTVGGNETVAGTLGVTGNTALGGSLSVAGTLGVTGNTALGGSLSVAGSANFGSAAAQATISAAGVYSGPSATYTGNVSVGGTLGVTGQATFTLRPTFNGATPWDSANLPGSVTSGVLNLTSRPTFAGNTPWDSANFNPANYVPVMGGEITGTLTVGTTSSSPGIANSSSGVSITQTGYIAASRTNGGGYTLYVDSSSGSLCYFGNSVTQSGSITTNGTATAYNTSSDYRLKDEVLPLSGEDAAALITRGKPCTFIFKSDASRQRITGFIAHELQEIIPEAVHGEKDGMQPDPFYEGAGDAPFVPKYQGVDAAKAVPVLWAALRHALDRIDALESK